MKMKKNINKFNIFAFNKIFLSLDALGLLIIAGNAFLFNNNTLLTLGITFLTLGLTIPISLYFQTKQNNESFEIINACHNYGIENIFEGRKYDKSYNRLRIRIDEAFNVTKNVDLLGIAFPELLNPESARDSATKKCLKNTEVKIRIIVLNPDSQAATRRAIIEDPDKICEEGETICNIRKTIENHTKTIIKARLENKYGKEWKTHITDLKKSIKNGNYLNRIISDINIEIKITDFDPIAFVIRTDNTLFSEQYSFGRPSLMDNTATCIGGYLPIIQYKKLSNGYEFLKSHFEYIWNNQECTQDITVKHLEYIVSQVS